MVDKDLFLHDLSVVAIMKNEGHYIKEWLDYHLLAGVDHFYLYDNESPDNQAEVVKPYVEAGIVDYFHMPGKAMQMVAYNDAVKRFKFQSRYMAFIDGDEFIYPKTGQSVVEVVDALLNGKPNAAGLAVNWQCFGSNGQEKADYSRGVLERFTRRAPSNWIRCETIGGNQLIKNISNPRAINFVKNPHYSTYFEGLYSVNEYGGLVESWSNAPVTVEKIVMNHYNTKSREEYFDKISRGTADNVKNIYNMSFFEIRDRNDEFDDGILKYRDERAKNFKLPDKSGATKRLLDALMKNLSPMILPKTPPSFYKGKLETFLTCRAVAEYLRTKLPDNKSIGFLEEAALKAIVLSLSSGGMTFADLRLLLSELPNLLALPYPVVKNLHGVVLNIIPQMMNVMRLNNLWKDYTELDYLQRLLKISEG